MARILPLKKRAEKRRWCLSGSTDFPTKESGYVQEGVLGVTLEYPLCVGKASEVGLRLLKEPGFKPEKAI
mgnify:CR=1 FL=1